MKLRVEVALVNAPETNRYPEQTHRSKTIVEGSGRGLGSRG